MDTGNLIEVLRQHGIVDVSPYRGIGQNQLRIGGFPSIDPEDTEALVECISYVIEHS